MLTEKELNSSAPQRYYENLGRAHDNLLRCKDCQKLVTFDVITKIGACDKCGNKRFAEIIVLSEEERNDIANGKIDFANKDEFLAEFPKGVEV